LACGGLPEPICKPLLYKSLATNWGMGQLHMCTVGELYPFSISVILLLTSLSPHTRLSQAAALRVNCCCMTCRFQAVIGCYTRRPSWPYMPESVHMHTLASDHLSYVTSSHHTMPLLLNASPFCCVLNVTRATICACLLLLCVHASCLRVCRA
jgi:hypothetical protein